MAERLDIMNAVYGVKVVDTHEHLMRESDRLKMQADPLHVFLPHYLSSDLISSGMTLDELNSIRSVKTPLEERWQVFLPYWQKVENTGYAQAIKIAVKDLYGIDEFDSAAWKPLKEAMEKRQQAGFYRWVLRTKGGIEVSINDSLFTIDVESELQVPVMRFDNYATPLSRDDLATLSARTGIPIHSLDDLLEALESEFAGIAKQIVGVKIGLAYQRTLNFEKVTYAEAEDVFNRIYRTRSFRRKEVMPYPAWPIGTYSPEGMSFDEAKTLQDFVVHRIIQLAERYALPVQIHTGMQEGNENIVSNSNPTLLTDLIREYKNVKFDIFHASYPYARELAVLAKNFPNVYPDLCWVHIVSPTTAGAILSEWLDLVPSNKILGFGGDYRFVEGVYGHVVLARRNVAAVLQEKVASGEIELRQVPYLASRVLRENARELYGLAEDAG
jgi:predicted TIM-barrel fold metal-dependent hydrolase